MQAESCSISACLSCNVLHVITTLEPVCTGIPFARTVYCKRNQCYLSTIRARISQKREECPSEDYKLSYLF
jgi:hypothetical protein